MIANLIIVIISNVFSKIVSTWKPTDTVAPLALGYPYDIDDTEE